MKKITTNFLILIIISIYNIAYSDYYYLEESDKYIVTGTSVYFRSSKSEESNKISKVKIGDILTIIPSERSDDDWLLVSNKNTKGFINTKYLQLFNKSNQESIYLDIVKNKYIKSKNNYKDLVEINEFIEKILLIVTNNEILNTLIVLRNDISKKMFSLITKRTTYGNKSPIISNVSGNVNIVYNPNSGNKLRITYYRLKGIGADLLMKGMLSTKWEKILGGQQSILNNIVLKNAKKTIKMFAMDASGDVVYGGEENNSKTIFGYITDFEKKSIKKYNNKNYLGKFYLEGRGNNYEMFLSDKINIMRQLEETKTKGLYKTFSSCDDVVFDNNEDNEDSIKTILWRYIGKNDIDKYSTKITEYINTIKDRNINDKNTNFLEYKYDNQVIKAIRYITKNKFPSDFIIASGVISDEKWSFNFIPRDIEIQIAVIENISNKSIKIGKLKFSEYSENKLISYKIVNSLLNKSKIKATNIWVSNYLAPFEKIIIPTRVSFVSNFNYTKCSLKNNSSNYNYPKITERYNYGTSWMLHSIEIDSKLAHIRKANFNQLNLYLGNEKGACPFVYTNIKNQKFWKSQGHMLLGATSKNQSRVDVIELVDFSGVVKISENKNEISFIKNIYIEEITKNNKHIIYKPQKSEINFQVLRGNPKVFNFKEIIIKETSKYYLYMEGFYVIRASLRM